MKSLAFSVLFLSIFGHEVHSQVVNIENMRTQTDTTGWLGSLGASFALNKTVEEVFGVNLEAHLQYKSKDTRSLWLIIGDYGFLQGGGQKFISSTFAHTRYNYKINDLLRWEVFLQAQNNLVTKIDWRFLAGTGPRFKIVGTKKIRLYVASLMMYEHEKEITSPSVVHRDLRNSSYISFTFIPSPSVELVSTSFYQPLLKYIKDHRLLNQVALKVHAGKKLSMNMRWNYLYDRFPAADIPHTTYNLTSGFEYDF